MCEAKKRSDVSSGCTALDEPQQRPKEEVPASQAFARQGLQGVGLAGFEPTTSCTPSKRASQAALQPVCEHFWRPAPQRSGWGAGVGLRSGDASVLTAEGRLSHAASLAARMKRPPCGPDNVRNARVRLQLSRRRRIRSLEITQAAASPSFPEGTAAPGDQ